MNELIDTTPVTVSESEPARRLSRREDPALSTCEGWMFSFSFVVAVAQLALLALVVYFFRIEARTFRATFAIACCGFVVHHYLPQRFKLPFFVGLSLVTMAATLGVANGSIILAVGLVLIGICHLPVSWTGRIAALVIAALVLAAVRVEILNIPHVAAVLTILGSMFMFRLIIYVYDVRNGVPRGFWQAAGYFFMMPNPCFPLFPIVDYHTFVRTAYKGPRPLVYQTGLRFIFRGILQLLLLRYINGVLRIDVDSIASAGDLFAFMVLAFASYLKVSGTFHIIVGMLHLFEFNLPETNNNYLLSSSFTDFWRRINIYWKDFIQKIIFYPMYFRLKRLGLLRAVALSTLLSIVISWALHSYQWFWLKGVVLLSPVDMFFWGRLGILLTTNVWYETRFARQRALAKSDQSLKAAVMRGIRTSVTMTVILLLWSLWTTDSFGVWWRIMQQAANGSVAQYATILGCLGLLGVVAALEPLVKRRDLTTLDAAPRLDPPAVLWRSAPIFTGAILLLFMAQPALQSHLGPTFAMVADLVKTPRFNLQGNAILEQGYYENLTNAARLNPELAELYALTPADWPGDNPVRMTKNWMIFEVTPSREFRYYRTKVTTNRWGMRDREYELAKPSGTLRVGLFGESHTFGNGVPNDLLYKQLAEDRINEQGLLSAGRQLELMNFSTPGYGPISKLAHLEKDGFPFDLDAVIQTAVSNEKEWSVRNLVGAVIEGAPIPYEFLNDIVAKAQVNKDMTPAVIKHRLSPYRDELIRWTYARLAESCRQHGVRPYLLFVPKPEYDVTAKKAFAELAEIAKSNGIAILDITGAYGSEFDLHSLWVAPWDNHPNVRGHQLLADALIRALEGPAGRELLNSATQAPPRQLGK